MSDIRRATDVVPAQPTSDGAGVRLFRSLGTSRLPYVDPFLMLDEFRSDRPGDYLAGFPSHPHRGFETVTYMLAGRMQHRDSLGTTGDLGPGSVQWMTAGRGIIHSEMPQQEEGLMWGFQLWVNLPRSDKMTAPRYQDIPAADIPEVTGEGWTARVVAGTVAGSTGPVGGVATDPTMVDVRVTDRFALDVPREHGAFLYVFEGSVVVPGVERAIPRGHLVVLSAGDRVEIGAGPAGGRFLLLAGRPLHEPVARHGPFVMSTRDELVQAFEDYQAGRLAV